MRILAISNLYPPHEIGGYEIRCRDLCERLRAAGHEVRVLTSDHRVAGRQDSRDERVSRVLRIHGMYGHPWLPIHRLHTLERHNHDALRREIDAVNPELIHVWNMGGLSKSLLLRLEQSGLPVVYDVSDHWIARSLRADVWLSWWNAPGSPARRLARSVAGALGIRGMLDRRTPTASWDRLRFRRIYFCSAFMRDLTASKGWPVAHGGVIHCGIDTAAFEVKGGHAGFSRLLWVGRLAEDKDPLTAVRAVAAARQAGLAELELDLFGHGDRGYVQRLEREIAALGLDGVVRLTSAPAAEMRGLYARYDALLFTSNWGEPFALTPLEAMAAGLPVITSLDGGQTELARHGVNCLVAAAADAALYAKRIAELAADAGLRAALAANALAEVRTRFDLAPVCREIEMFLRESLAP